MLTGVTVRESIHPHLHAGTASAVFEVADPFAVNLSYFDPQISSVSHRIQSSSELIGKAHRMTTFLFRAIKAMMAECAVLNVRLPDSMRRGDRTDGHAVRRKVAVESATNACSSEPNECAIHRTLSGARDRPV